MDKKHTIRDIAKLAGVSAATVSKIMNNTGNISDQTRQRVKKIIQDTGYVPTFSAKTLATNRSKLIGVIIGGQFNVGFTHPFFSLILNNFKDFISEMGYDFVFFSKDRDYLERCHHYNIDGCLIMSGDETDEGSRQLDESHIPVVGVDMILSGTTSSYIMTDNYMIAEKVVRHAHLNGIRKIAFIGGNECSFITQQRESGFRKALHLYNLECREEWIVYGDYFDQSGYDSMNQILDGGDLPELVFACSDFMAFGAIEAIKERGMLVPNRIAVIGCDDIEACRFTTPKLTTVRQDKKGIGRLAGQMLIDLIEKGASGQAIMVEPQLVLRESCR
ncbi:LacI family DNA-binding transcriptional regulator [Paenibacillus xylanilyticus]|uniref:LacI family DNA-binding transcriptional regulator n=1 Tax=Paenibacillus xylanilyticus TaxID=248903 RepID=UPI0039A36904